MGSHTSVLPTNTKVFINNEPFCLLKSHRVQTAAPSSTWLHEFFFFESFFFLFFFCDLKIQLLPPTGSRLHFFTGNLLIYLRSDVSVEVEKLLQKCWRIATISFLWLVSLGVFLEKELATCILFLFQPTYWFLVRKSDSKTSFLF